MLLHGSLIKVSQNRKENNTIFQYFLLPVGTAIDVEMHFYDQVRRKLKIGTIILQREEKKYDFAKLKRTYKGILFKLHFYLAQHSEKRSVLYDDNDDDEMY